MTDLLPTTNILMKNHTCSSSDKNTHQKIHLSSTTSSTTIATRESLLPALSQDKKSHEIITTTKNGKVMDYNLWKQWEDQRRKHLELDLISNSDIDTYSQWHMKLNINPHFIVPVPSSCCEERRYDENKPKGKTGAQQRLLRLQRSMKKLSNRLCPRKQRNVCGDKNEQVVVEEVME